MKKTVMILILIILIFCLASCSAKPQDNKIDQINTDKTSLLKAVIAHFEKNVGAEVRESIVSSDGLVALLVESDSERRQKEYGCKNSYRFYFLRKNCIKLPHIRSFP